MSGVSLKRLTGLVLALLLAAPAALCGDCCCTATPAKAAPVSQERTAAAAHGCCPSKAPGAVVEAADGNCGCAETASVEPLPLTSATRTDAKHAAQSSALALTVDAFDTPRPAGVDRLELDASSPPTASRRSPAAPRAPPVLS